MYTQQPALHNGNIPLVRRLLARLPHRRNRTIILPLNSNMPSRGSLRNLAIIPQSNSNMPSRGSPSRRLLPSQQRLRQPV